MPCIVGKNSRWQHLLADRCTGFDYNKIPDLPGIYAIYFNSHLVYIGSSGNLRKRFWHHRFCPRGSGLVDTPWGERQLRTIRLKWRTTDRYGEWLMIEARLIRRIRPALNKHHQR